MHLLQSLKKFKLDIVRYLKMWYTIFNRIKEGGISYDKNG